MAVPSWHGALCPEPNLGFRTLYFACVLNQIPPGASNQERDRNFYNPGVPTDIEANEKYNFSTLCFKSEHQYNATGIKNYIQLFLSSILQNRCLGKAKILNF